jgi:tripartite-type tricarboxylate transporter receptor subunit TctC
MDRREFLHAAAGVGAMAALQALPAWAQGPAWPDKPLRWVLSQPPGSGPDNVARMLGEQTARDLGQGVVIDNKPGGQNVIGAQAAAHATADGYTMYFATTAALVTNSFLFKTLPYDPQKDFVPVAFIASSPFAVLVRAESPIISIQDLVARSKAAPGKLSLGNEGPRTFGGIIARLMNARTGMQANLVPYASVSVSLTDLMGGHTDSVVADLASTAQLVRQGKLRLLAVTSAKRIAGWEQTPALAETLPGFEMVGWFGLVAPAGTPQAVVGRMSGEMNKLLGDKEMADRILNVGPIVEPAGTPEKFGAFLQEERQRWAQVAKEIGLLPE